MLRRAAAGKTAAVLVLVIAVAALAAIAFFTMSGPQTATTTPSTTTSPAAAEATPAPSGEVVVVKVGGLFDLSGPTSDVGKMYAYGVMDCIKYYNEKGIYWKGKRVKIELITRDYGYKVPEAFKAYKEFKSAGVVAIIGWGTGDTEALAPHVAKDKIVYISASYSARLTNRSYNFFPVPDYSTQLRAALKWIAENWKEDRPPRIMFMYPDVPYGLAPIPAGKAYAKELGFEILPDQIVPLTATDASSQVLEAKKHGADFVWIGGTVSSASVVARDAKRLGLNAKLIINVWGFDEKFVELAGPAAEGVIGLAPVAYPGEKEMPWGPVTEMNTILKVAKENGRGER